MKTCACLALVLYVLIEHHTEAQPFSMVNRPESCCFDFFKGNIPRGNIVSVQKIYPRCPKPGFIVTTKKGKPFCMGPDFQLKKKQKE